MSVRAVSRRSGAGIQMGNRPLQIARLIQCQTEVKADLGVVGAETVGPFKDSNSLRQSPSLKINRSEVVIGFSRGRDFQAQPILALGLIQFASLGVFCGALKVRFRRFTRAGGSGGRERAEE